MKIKFGSYSCIFCGELGTMDASLTKINRPTIFCWRCRDRAYINSNPGMRVLREVWGITFTMDELITVLQAQVASPAKATK